MRTNTYLVHNQETGEVIHLHVEPSDLGSSLEEIIHLADRRGTRGLVATLLPAHSDGSQPARIVDGEPTSQDVPNWGYATIDGGPIDPDIPRRYMSE